MKNKYFLFLVTFLFIFSFSFTIYAQTDSLSGTYIDENGKYYQQADLPVYLHISTSPNGEKIPLSGRKVGEKQISVQPIILDGHGMHVIKHNDGKNSRNSYEYIIYADGLPPISTAKFLTPNIYRKNGTTFYGQNLEIELNTKDQMSGIEGFYYNLDETGMQPYTNSFPINSEGNHSLKYFSLDKVGNVETEKTKEFVIDVSPPISTYNIVGINSENVISLSTKIYFTLEDNNVGVKNTFYRFDDQSWKPYYNKRNLPLRALSDGNHTVDFYSIDYLKNKETTQSFSFYLDKTAPIMSADVLGDKFIVGQQVYFSGRTKLKLTAVDNKSGVKEVWYSIDGGEWIQYTDPFYLPSKSGTHKIRYYAIDNTENIGVEGSINPRFDTYRHSVSAVYVDLTGPKLDYKLQGKSFKKENIFYLSPETNIKLIARDNESGLKNIAYRINGQGEEIEYKTPFTLKELGVQNIEIIGYDNVNNRNVINTSLNVDTEAPTIFYHFSTMIEENRDTTYPSYVQLFLGAQDAQTNTEQIYYRINGGGKRLYNGKISGFAKNKSYTILVEVKDKLGNIAKEEIIFETLEY